MPKNADVDATAESLTGGTATPIPLGNDVFIRAHPDNTGNVAIGFANTVTCDTVAATDGIMLDAGEGYLVKRDRVTGADAANIYVCGSAANQVVLWDFN